MSKGIVVINIAELLYPDFDSNYERFTKMTKQHINEENFLTPFASLKPEWSNAYYHYAQQVSNEPYKMDDFRVAISNYWIEILDKSNIISLAQKLKNDDVKVYLTSFHGISDILNSKYNVLNMYFVDSTNLGVTFNSGKLLERILHESKVKTLKKIIVLQNRYPFLLQESTAIIIMYDYQEIDISKYIKILSTKNGNQSALSD